MRKSLKVCATALMLAGALMLGSCSLWYHSLEYNKTTNIYTDKRNGVTYTDAPFRYEAVKMGKKYGKQTGQGGETVFYTIEGMDPAEWLTEEWGTVFYATSMPLPTLAEMEPVEVLICIEETSTFVVAEITGSDDIAELISEWENGEALEYPAVNPTLSRRVKFVSEKYPGIYYSLIYLEYSDGGKYLYSRDDGRFVEVGSLISDALEGKSS